MEDPGPSPFPTAGTAAHEPVHGQGDVPSDPDPAVSDPQDQRRVQPMVELREAVGPGSGGGSASCEDCRTTAPSRASTSRICRENDARMLRPRPASPTRKIAATSMYVV